MKTLVDNIMVSKYFQSRLSAISPSISGLNCITNFSEPIPLVTSSCVPILLFSLLNWTKYYCYTNSTIEEYGGWDCARIIQFSDAIASGHLLILQKRPPSKRLLEPPPLITTYRVHMLKSAVTSFRRANPLTEISCGMLRLFHYFAINHSKIDLLSRRPRNRLRGDRRPSSWYKCSRI